MNPLHLFQKFVNANGKTNDLLHWVGLAVLIYISTINVPISPSNVFWEFTRKNLHNCRFCPINIPDYFVKDRSCGIAKYTTNFVNYNFENIQKIKVGRQRNYISWKSFWINIWATNAASPNLVIESVPPPLRIDISR